MVSSGIEICSNSTGFKKRDEGRKKIYYMRKKRLVGLIQLKFFFSSGFNIKGRKKKNPSNALVFMKGKEADAI